MSGSLPTLPKRITLLIIKFSDLSVLLQFN